ncbi:UNVERIFIED_CONTAM: hypothetical protein RKD43_005703 [Streptomyces graminofaciens]
MSGWVRASPFRGSTRPPAGSRRAASSCWRRPAGRPWAAGAGLRRTGSGIISVDNNDPTAQNCWLLRREAGLPYEHSLHWNIVPWYLGTADRIAAAGRTDVQLAAPFLHEVISLLPKLEVVVPMGRSAQAGWAAYVARYAPAVRTLATWHPSPRGLASRPAARPEILRTMREVARLTVREDADPS